MKNFITTEQNENSLIVNITGAIDGMTVPYLKKEDVMKDHDTTHVILNLSSVSFIDSAGISAVVSFYKAIKSEGGSMIIVGASGQPADLVKTLGLDKVIRFTDSKDEAKILFQKV